LIALPAWNGSGEDQSIKDEGHVAAQNHIVNDQARKENNGRQSQGQPAALVLVCHLVSGPQFQQRPKGNGHATQQTKHPVRKALHRAQKDQR